MKQCSTSLAFLSLCLGWGSAVPAATISFGTGANVTSSRPYLEQRVQDTDTFESATRPGETSASSSSYSEIIPVPSCPTTDSTCLVTTPMTQYAQSDLNFDWTTGIIRGRAEAYSSSRNYFTSAAFGGSMTETVTVSRDGALFANFGMHGDYTSNILPDTGLPLMHDQIFFEVLLVNQSAYRRDPFSNYSGLDTFSLSSSTLPYNDYVNQWIATSVPVLAGDEVYVAFNYHVDFSLERGFAVYDFSHTAYASLSGSEGQTWTGSDPSFLSNTPSVPAVPLPASALLMLGAFGGLAGLRSRRLHSRPSAA